MTELEWIQPTPARPLTGDESFAGVDATVKAFWAYAFRDLRTNTTRGILAEWLVSKAVGAEGVQEEWAEFDVLTPEGVRVEVKASAYLQSWGQRRLTPPSFSRLTARKWTPEDGEAEARTHNADVYVFCVQTAKTHAEYDPLDVAQWEFYVVPRAVVEGTGYRSFGLPTLRTLADGPSTFAEVRHAVLRAAGRTS